MTRLRLPWKKVLEIIANHIYYKEDTRNAEKNHWRKPEHLLKHTSILSQLMKKRAISSDCPKPRKDSKLRGL